MKTKMKGKDVVKELLSLAEGESILVGVDEWTAFEGFFEKTADFGEGESYFVYFDGLDDEVDVEAQYEVLR